LSNRTRNILIVLVVLVIMIGSRFIWPLPRIPEISLAPEALARFGPFPFANSLLTTIIVDIVLIALVVAGLGRMQTVPRGLQNILEISVELLYGLSESIDRRNVRRFFTIAATIFFFVFFSNLLEIIPGVGSIGICRTHEAALVNPVSGQPAPKEPAAKEGAKPQPAADTCGTSLVLVPFLRPPSADLNMTLSLALIVFVATEYFGFHDLGFGYLSKFFSLRRGAMGLFVGFLEFISEFVRVIAFTFRLFGNIFAGEVVLLVMAFLAPWLLPLPFYGFELFVAFIQAFIFAVLALAFMSLATESHGGEHAEQGGTTHGHDAEARQQTARVYET
jgi:F-type H+-transporting ATPase subunit a